MIAAVLTSRRANGFTLTELLVVIGIILTLAAALMPLYAKSRQYAHTSVCAANLFEIGLALQMYAENWSGTHPPKERNLAPVARYHRLDKIMRCPSNFRNPEDRGEYNGAFLPPVTYGVMIGSDYYYNSGLTNEAAADALLVSDLSPLHDKGANVLFATGNVKWLHESQWEKILPAEGRMAIKYYAAQKAQLNKKRGQRQIPFPLSSGNPPKGRD